ncbi:MAG: hypothetical protein SFU99_04075, partial [Saprospiraceae bacterium]|nr:hypothetical protein [Saprospiraceae bacterium]
MKPFDYQAVLTRTLAIICLIIAFLSPTVAQNVVYVSSRNTHAVKLYDLATGNFIKDFVPAGSGGLS